MFSLRPAQLGFSLLVALAGSALLELVAIAANPADIRQLLQTNRWARGLAG